MFFNVRANRISLSDRVTDCQSRYSSRYPKHCEKYWMM